MMLKRQAKDEFEMLCKLFYQGSRDDHPSFDAWVEATVQERGAEGKILIKKYLDDLFARSPTDDELERRWQATSPSYGFSKGGHRLLFETILAKINQSPS